MMLSQKIKKVKEWIGEHDRELTMAAVILLVGLGSFGIGRLSVLWPKKEPIIFTKWENPLEDGNRPSTAENGASGALPRAPVGQSASVLEAIKEGKYVGSRNGTVYHFPWCPGAKQIKEENKIYFNTKEEAQRAGYRPAANCEGL